MKVDTSKLKKGTSELTPECRQLIEQITKCRSRTEMLQLLQTVQVWVYGKCELYHWIEILDRFDKVLDDATRCINGNEFVLQCDTSFSEQDISLLLLVINFTTLLIEHSFSRHLYNSTEHLTQLLSSQNMQIVLAVLNLLYMFSKRSNFIPRLSFEKKQKLLTKLFNIAERWGDPNYGLALIDCCSGTPKLEFMYDLFMEYTNCNGQATLLEIPDILDICKNLTLAEIVKIICSHVTCSTDAIKMRIAHRVRLVSGLKDSKLRLQLVQARLQAISVLIYSNALQENTERILYSGFGEELCELIDKEDVELVDIRAAVLRTLTSMLHFDRNPNVPRPGSRLPKIIEYTGAERKSGILPVLVRDCIHRLTGSVTTDKYPLVLATSLFSLLYHLASYEAGGHALVKSGMMQSLLRVICWPGIDLEHITFVTRAVRVIDLITNIDIAKFHQNNGLNIFIDRLNSEVYSCLKEIKDIEPKNNKETTRCNQEESSTNSDAAAKPIIIDSIIANSDLKALQDKDISEPNDSNENESISTYDCFEKDTKLDVTSSPNINAEQFVNERNEGCNSVFESMHNKKLACATQRAALLKSMLNFLKKSIQDHAYFNGMRNIMETSLPCSLRHIISNAEYYGPSLFLLATDVITIYVLNEPSLLSPLQESGITNIMLKSLLQKDVPATREILGSLPNMFSALCLNERGLMEFMSYEPFDKLLRVLLSPDYLVAMRRRRSSDPLGDTATNLGNAMDDLMKHHPYLRTDATEAIVRLLTELVRLGSDPKYVCWRANKDNIAGHSVPMQNFGNANVTNGPASNENKHDSSGEDDDDDDEMSSASQQQRHSRLLVTPQQQTRANQLEREAIPLIDYILNVMKFIEAIFSNSSNGDHCREFVLHGGLKPLLQLLSLPNLPVDSPVSTTSQAVANVCKSILNLSHETKVIDAALEQLTEIVRGLKPLIKHFSFPEESVLLYELLHCPKIEDGFSVAEYTPLLHSMSAVHGYVVMLVHLCRNASNDMRLILLKRWGAQSESGLQLLQNLVQLYISLVWESTILLNLCSDDLCSQNKDLDWNKQSTFAESEFARILYNESGAKMQLKPEEQLRYIKSLLAASSRLGRALAELFGTLVKLSVGTPQSRQRRDNEFVGNILSNRMLTSDAKEIARVLSSILVNGFNHETILPKPAPKLKLTFLICSVGFTGPMLFDDKRSSFHLMMSQFCEENGLKAFFDMFYWALSINSPTQYSYDYCLKVENILEEIENDKCGYHEGTGEFLDAWLQLLEKMVNTRSVLDSPYAIPPQTDIVHFEPTFYLLHMHQLALQAIRHIWKRKPISNYGVSMTETIMLILKHLIKSHELLCERYQMKVKEIQNAKKTMEQNKKPAPTQQNKVVNAGQYTILLDMGFLHEQIINALQNTNSLEQATDFLLNQSHAITTNNILHRSSHNANIEMDIDEDAVLLPSTSCVPNVSSSSTSNKNVFSEIKLIPKKTFNAFCEEALKRVFAFMEYLPETVSSGVDLISVLYRRLGDNEKKLFILNMVKNIKEWSDHILRNLKNIGIKSSKLEDFLTGPTSTKLMIRLKVSCLLLDEIYSDIRKEFSVILSQEQTVNSFIMLLYKTEAMLEEQTTKESKRLIPSWLQNLIELIDAIDNVSIILQRKSNMQAVCSEIWKWYDVSTGKWNSYSETNNVLIRNAFSKGDRSVVITIGRQRYTINFNCMTQVSEASGSHRPVLPSLKISDAMAMLSSGSMNSNSKIDTILTRTIKSIKNGNGTVQQDELLCLTSLLNLNASGSNAAKETHKETDVDFPNQDLNTSSSSSRHPSSQSSEDPPLLADVSVFNESNIVKKIRARKENKPLPSEPSPSPSSKRIKKIVLHEEPVGLAKFNMKEIISCLVRIMHPKLFLSYEIKLSILKLCARLTKDYENAKIFYRNDGLNLLFNMRQPCGLMSFPTYAIVIIRHLLEAPLVLQEAMEQVLTRRTHQSIPAGHRDLLFVLTQVSSAVARQPLLFLEAAKLTIRPDMISGTNLSIDESRLLVKSQPNRKTNSQITTTEEEKASIQTSIDIIKKILHAIIQPCAHYGGFVAPEDEYETTLVMGATSQPEESSSSMSACKTTQEKLDACCCSWHIPSNGHVHYKPILPRSTLLKILADCVRSYNSLVPSIIYDHIYTPSDSILIKKKQSFLSFILDNFLPIIRVEQDCEVSMMCRVLISSLSDCIAQPSIQHKIVEEIHDAIVRSLAQPESTEKHIRLQVLISLFPVMIESPMLSNKIHVQRNNMYRVLLNHGLMTWLSKIPQYKDLSNSNSLSTINSVLRPMEILLRLTITPGSLSSKRVLLGAGAHGTSSTVNRRFYPRFTSSLTSSATSNSIGSENVLRDIIRNVLSDRRHAFDFILNADDLFGDNENSVPAVSNDADIDVEEEEDEEEEVNNTNRRPQLNFDRLWEDILHSESLRLVNLNTNETNASSGSRINRHHSNEDVAGNIDNDVSGSSNGVSILSVPTAVVSNNDALLGDVSTSESESDSNVSTENDDRNDVDDEDDDGNEETIEDRSEADADEENRQFIEIFDHIYEPESSETTSNDADVDADDEESTVACRNENDSTLDISTSAEQLPSGSNSQRQEENRDGNILIAQQRIVTDNIPTRSEVANFGISQSFATNNTTVSVRTTPSSAWSNSRAALIETIGQMPTATSNISERNESTRTNNSTAISAPLTGGQRREPTRRLIYLDQQYCAPMPSLSNPTEEGQLELFNQDALHWWLEEAKHLDLESQTDACLYVAHFLIPFLINELKLCYGPPKNEPSMQKSGITATLNRRSAIPILIQQSLSTATGSTQGVNNSAELNSRDLNTRSHTTLPESSFEQAQRLVQQDHNPINLVSEIECPSQYEPFAALSGSHTVVPDASIRNDSVTVVENEQNNRVNITMMEEEEQEPTLTNRTSIRIDLQQDVDAINRSDALTELFSMSANNLHINEATDARAVTPVPIIDIEEDATACSIDVNAPSLANDELSSISRSLRSISTARSTTTNVAEMSQDVRAVLGSLEVPEGVDPSFLAALPSDMREEVIQEHLRMQRFRQRAQQNANQVVQDSLLEVNPEFLAALPPNIQSEVLMQQRIEQQRQAAQTANPNDPVDTAAFFQNLPDSLRQAILTDMEESQIASLPPDIAAEAQYLRRDWESHNSARLDVAQSSAISGYLTARIPTPLQRSSRWHPSSIWYDANGVPQTQLHHHTSILHQQQFQGKPIALLLMEDGNNLLDTDCLSTLLLFVFIDDPKMNYTRLHRVVRNLCHHLPTREWVISSLLSIIRKTNEENYGPSEKELKPQWLKLRIDAAFGYQSNVFTINKYKIESNETESIDSYCIRINPQAAQMVVKNCLEMLSVLAKQFPRSFMPQQDINRKCHNKEEESICTTSPPNETINVPASTYSSDGRINNNLPQEVLRSTLQRQQTNLNSQTPTSENEIEGKERVVLDETPSTSKEAASRSQLQTNLSAKNSKFLGLCNDNTRNFWNVLLNIDMSAAQRMTNVKTFSSSTKLLWEGETPDDSTLGESAFASLLGMLPYKVICRSPQLTDMLVKLLASLSTELPNEEKYTDEKIDASKLNSVLHEESTSNTNKTSNEMFTQKKSFNEANLSLNNEDFIKKKTSAKCKQSLYSKSLSQLVLVIEVLTHRCGTSESLDSISKLILNLSRCSLTSNVIFLHYLTAAVLGLAREVRYGIKNLLNEVQNYNSINNKNRAGPSLKPIITESFPKSHQGILQDRFTANNVVISTPSNFQPVFELHLPSMKKFISSSSAQPYFLRSLKILIQTRDVYESKGMESCQWKNQTLSQIICLEDLWNTLSECLQALEESKDEYAVLVLQPSVEAFFLIHASQRKTTKKSVNNLSSVRDLDVLMSSTPVEYERPVDSIPASTIDLARHNEQTQQPRNFTFPTPSAEDSQLKLDREKFLSFAEKHRTVLNQILRQSPIHLSDGPFAVLVDHTRILDFDVKRKYFQTELERLDEGVRREENTVSVRRSTVFEDSFRVLYRLGPEEWKNRFYIVFEDEEGQDAGGLLREWYVIISREIFNPMYALFCVSPGDRVTYMINPSSYANPNHLSYFKFVGRVIAKAIHDTKLLECYFTRSFYKHILGKQVKYTDMESQDYEFYKGLDYLMKNDISTLGYELTFSTEVQEFGVTQVRDLIPNGRNIAVTEENKFDYVQLVCELKMSGSIRQQLDAFLEGFYDIIPKHLISIFNEQELELLISGLPDIDIEDLKANTEFHKYTSKSIQIQWFWRALRSFDQADRAKFLQFVTGTSKVPLQGFGSLEGMNGIQKFQIHRDDRSTDRLPCAHTCFNQLDLPMYKSYEKLRSCLLKAIHECSEGFGFA